MRIMCKYCGNVSDDTERLLAKEPYTPDGWFNTDTLFNDPDTFVVCTGGRGVGRTLGVLRENLISDVTLAINSIPGGRSDLISVFASTAFLEWFKRNNRFPTGVMGVKIVPIVSDELFYCVGYGHCETK